MPEQLNYDVPLVTRAEWGARPPRSVTRLASGKVTSHWEGPHMGAFPHESCASKVRQIQNFHMDSRGWSDIAYNVLSCPHGVDFEGRGQGVRSAANGTTAGNNGAYAVCYLGGEGDGFTEAGERGVKAAGDWLTFAGSERNCHRDWKPTACPGNEICDWTHDGQPITWSPISPLPPLRKDRMYALIVATDEPSGAQYLTDGMWRLWLNSPTAVAQTIWNYAVAGIEIKTGPNNTPIKWLDWQVATLRPLRPDVDDHYLPWADTYNFG